MDKSRRKALGRLVAITVSTLIPSTLYSNSELISKGEVVSNKYIEERDICLGIYGKKENFNYNGKIKTEPWASELKKNGIEYIVDRSENILKERNRKYLAITRNIELDLSSENFRKIITTNPAEIIPLTTEVLNDYNYPGDKIVSAATVKENELEKGLWYANKEDVGKELRGKISIPYIGESEMLIYGDGTRWGLTGEFVGLIQYKEINNKVHLDTTFFVTTSGWGIFSRAGRSHAANMVRDNATILLKNSEKLVNVVKNNDISKEKYGYDNISYLNELDL